MQSWKTIQKTWAVLLLLVFCISATPKQFLHHIFAGHHDEGIHCNDIAKHCIHPQTFHCHADHPVVHVEYTPAILAFDELYIITKSLKYEYILQCVSLPCFLGKENKGPPAFC